MTKHTIGVDISKDYLDVHCLGDDRTARFGNGAAGFRELEGWLPKAAIARIVYEATGPYHAAFEMRFASRYPLVKVNPLQARRFAQSKGTRAKTDAVDARMLAAMGAAFDLEPSAPMSQNLRDLKEMQVATPLFERCDDSSGIVIGVFHDACALLGEIALAAGTPPEALADSAVEALRDNGYGQYDGLIAILTPALGAEGLAHLKARIEALAATPVPVPPKGEWEAVGHGSGGATYAHQMEERARQSLVRTALKDIADAMGDVDAFIAQYDPATRKVPKIAAEIAARLLAAGRAGHALGFIERAEVDKSRWVPREWQDARIKVLEALDRNDDAQAFRWACFERYLSPEYLRTFLKRLPDFEDIEAEERAMVHAAAHPGLLPALGFFLDWPSPARAARLLIDRHSEINGDRYEILVPAAETLFERYPLAATLALRAMIDFALTTARSKRYGYAAQHLVTCAELASRIDDFGAVVTHDVYVARLKAQHGRKYGFWGHSS